jgi:hypothetical protein
MTLKIERNSDGRRKLIRLIGRARSETSRGIEETGVFMNAFLLLAVIMIYVAIR